jgi:hypothetical protein
MADMAHPNRRIGEDQFDGALRRERFSSFGMVPPKDANRRAVSRSIRALRASRIHAVFSFIPVDSWAMRTRWSSKTTVILIRLKHRSLQRIILAPIEIHERWASS